MEAGDAQHLLHMNYEFLAEIDVKISIALATNSQSSGINWTLCQANAICLVVYHLLAKSDAPIFAIVSRSENLYIHVLYPSERN